jgi:hypothetical protein
MQNMRWVKHVECMWRNNYLWKKDFNDKAEANVFVPLMSSALKAARCGLFVYAVSC